MWKHHQGGVPHPPLAQNQPEAKQRFPHTHRVSTLQTRNVMAYPGTFGSSSTANSGTGNAGAANAGMSRHNTNGYQTTIADHGNYYSRPALPHQVKNFSRMAQSSTPPGHMPPDPGMYGGTPWATAANAKPQWGAMGRGTANMGTGAVPYSSMGAGGVPYSGMRVGDMPRSQRIQTMRMMKMQAAKHQLAQRARREDEEYKKVVSNLLLSHDSY